MKRQKLRKGLLLISFLFFPITLYYFSPILIVLGAFKGIVVGSFIMFVIMFLVSLVLGRAVCGWVCPAGGLQECCFLVVDRRVKGGKLNWIKYLIWIPWISLLVILFLKAGGIHGVDFFFETENGISVATPFAHIIYYSVLTLIVTLSLTAGKRAFCHYVCWMAPFMMIGSKLKQIFGWPSLQIRVQHDGCIQCQRCTRSCPMSLDVQNMVLENSLDDSECILCGECIDSCPKDVLCFSFRVRSRNMKDNEEYIAK